jgi:hypothetical protein
MVRRPLVLGLAVLLFATLAPARVISYAPYTDRISIPAMGLRVNRHFAMVETASNGYPPPGGRGQIVLYDSLGEEERRVVYPQNGSETYFDAVIVRQRTGEAPMIFASISDYPSARWVLSVDAGRTWKSVSIPGRLATFSSPVDTGGWYARSRYASLRIGPHEFPFIALTYASDGYHLTAVAIDGTTSQLMTAPANTSTNFAGSDFDHRRFLLRSGTDLVVVDIHGLKSVIGQTSGGLVEGWITANGRAYLEQWISSADISLWLYTNGTKTFVAGTYDKTNPTAVPPPQNLSTSYPLFAAPTASYDGAWIVKRLAGTPTKLLEHNPARSPALFEHWSDPSAPEVEAIHPSLTGNRVLIQVHRPRRDADALFKDPALAVWHVGAPLPSFYDELYLSEQADKGFVHLNVDELENGEPFVFDSGRVLNPGCGCGVSSGGGGGGDVTQEWGVVRASLAQHLVMPGFGRTAGAFGSLWRSDLTFSNPNDVSVNVALRFVPSGDAVQVSERNAVRIQLAPHELRLVNDAAKELLGVEGGVGALFIDPDVGASINVTGRTYTTSAAGTYGYGMNAIDIYSAANAGFPVTFAGAFLGPNFRTNLFLADVSGRGTAASFVASGPSGDIQIANVVTETSPAFGVLQRNYINLMLGLSAQTRGALTIKPVRGEAVAALFAVDNQTNDATFYPPDLSIGTTRTIPVVGHQEGVNGAQFRSDLFLYNTSSQYKGVNIEMRSWTNPSIWSVASLTLYPHEARMIPDVLMTLFGQTGMARLRIATQTFSTAPDTSVRVTSRTYSVDAKGGTYGFLMPPLNSFQSATTADTLEILGASLDRRFRTNIGLVDVTNAFTAATPRARVEIVGTDGKILDTMETNVPSVGGMQINDIFRSRGLNLDGAPVLIRITPLRGMIGAYAATLDNGTNDPTYFAANLAAK